MGNIKKVLLVGCSAADTGKLSNLLSCFSTIECARNIPELVKLLRRETYDAVLCDACFGQDTWREVLATAQRLAPGLPVIVVDHAGEEAEWVEVLNAGGFDLLAPPFENCNLESVLEHATASRNLQETCACLI
jgi:DNA-binding NtrC family response regulator